MALNYFCDVTLLMKVYCYFFTNLHSTQDFSLFFSKVNDNMMCILSWKRVIFQFPKTCPRQAIYFYITNIMVQSSNKLYSRNVCKIVCL